MTSNASLFTTLAIALSIALLPEANGQPPQPSLCCFTATCVSCEQIAGCETLTPFFFSVEEVYMPAATGYGFGTGLQNCGIDHPAGILCTSWTENSLALADGADCLDNACVDPGACNLADYDLTPWELTSWETSALNDLSLCDFPAPCEDCDGVCLYDVNANDICDCSEVFGCMDSLACNYVVESVWDLGNCTYPEVGFDCNGDCLDDDMDGICLLDEIYGCTDTLALNYHPFITEEDRSCVYPADFITDCSTCPDPCPGDLNDDLVISVSDILILLSYFTLSCPE